MKTSGTSLRQRWLDSAVDAFDEISELMVDLLAAPGPRLARGMILGTNWLGSAQ